MCLDQLEATGPTPPFCWQLYQASVSPAFCKSSSLKLFNITRGNLSTSLWGIPPICEDHCGYSLCFVKMTRAEAITQQTNVKIYMRVLRSLVCLTLCFQSLGSINFVFNPSMHKANANLLCIRNTAYTVD